MDWISRAIDLVVIVGLIAWTIWTANHPRASTIVPPGGSQGGPSNREFDALAGKVKQISLEWEDTHERLLRMARSARASARAAAGVNGGDERDGGAPPTDQVPPLTRAAVLTEYRRRNASHQ